MGFEMDSKRSHQELVPPNCRNPNSTNHASWHSSKRANRLEPREQAQRAIVTASTEYYDSYGVLKMMFDHVRNGNFVLDRVKPRGFSREEGLAV